MIVWLDAQLPRQLADWMRKEFGLDAWSMHELALERASDREIFEKARSVGAVILSKDSDFVDLVQSLGPPPQLVWITCGNVSNRRLMLVFQQSWMTVSALLASGEAIVELGDS